MRDLRIDFLGRPGCHLCELALPMVEEIAGRQRAVVRVIDIEDDDHLLGRYELRIPVVLAPDGVVLAEGEIDPKALRRAIRGWRRP